ncbi:MAG: hypothetical protein IT427_17445 [Pirellulales bacterium]|nr:hypothetical protein [Pirellulales bacterium]
MSLQSQTKLALANLSPFSGSSQSLSASAAGARIEVGLLTLDALALAFDHVVVARDALSAAPIEQLKKLADALAKQLTYLLEPISAVEVDADQCVVQMRSSPPQRDDNGTRYYELLVRRGGELSLRRFEKQTGNIRQAVPAHVTREVFLRLVDDFAGVAC